MSKRAESVRFFDFTGGLNTKSPVTSLPLNQASDLMNINLLPSGGFEKRRGNTEFNGSAMNSGADVQGLGYYKTSAGVDYLMAICGDKIFKSDSLDGTMDDITGAVVITAGQDNLWTHSQMNDLSIFVGGAPDAPIKWNATGNAAVLAGTPPNGSFGIAANNRFFIGNTTANPSRIAWSVLGDPEDYAGAGSGTQDVQANDGDTLVGATVLGYDHMLLFKQNSIHDLAIRNAPFPLYPLFRDIGCVSKKAIVNVDGIVYFITPEPRMKATDGTKIVDFPDTIDDVWDGLNKDRLEFIHGIYYRRLSQIWWFVSDGTSTTHDLVIVWDLKRKSWIRHPSGFGMNKAVIAQSRDCYGGAYDGKIYKFDVSTAFTDASDGAFTALWRTGWNDFGRQIESKKTNYFDLNYKIQGTGTFDFFWGYDFNNDIGSESIDMGSTSGIYGISTYGSSKYGSGSDRTKMVFPLGSGKFIQFAIRHNGATEGFSFNGIEIPVSVNQPATLKG